LILAFIYLIVLKIKETLYSLGVLKIQTLTCKVISVGNLTLGGTGKTPVVEYIARYLSPTRKTAILTRGYKRENKAAILEVLPGSSPRECGDEAVYLARETGLPVIAAVNRYSGGKYALEKFGTAFCILDDGFQRRWSLYRNLEILIIDASNPFGNGKLIPAGILREPVKSIMAADMIILSKVDAAKDMSGLMATIHRWNDFAEVIETVYEPDRLYNVFDPAERISLAEIAGKKVVTLSAVGNPEYFSKVVGKLNPAGIGRLSYRDHYSFAEKDIKEINEKAASADLIITTEKDAIKLQFLDKTKFEKKLLALKINLGFIKGEKELQDGINIR